MVLSFSFVEPANWGGFCFHSSTVCTTFTSAITQDHIKLKKFVVAKGLARYWSATICWEVGVGCRAIQEAEPLKIGLTNAVLHS